MKDLLREVYPQAPTQEQAVALFCVESGYKRAAVHQWLSGDKEPRPLILKWLRQRLVLERICDAAVALEIYVEGKENDALKPGTTPIIRHEIRDLVVKTRASCSPLAGH